MKPSVSHWPEVLHCEVCDSTKDVEVVTVNMPSLFTGPLAVCQKCRVPEDW